MSPRPTLEGPESMAPEAQAVLLELDSPVDDAEVIVAVVAAPPVNDREEQIRQVVDSRTSGRIRGLQVAVVEDSKVVISGRAATYYSKQLATHAALDVADAMVIQNDVIVG